MMATHTPDADATMDELFFAIKERIAEDRDFVCIVFNEKTSSADCVSTLDTKESIAALASWIKGMIDHDASLLEYSGPRRRQ